MGRGRHGNAAVHGNRPLTLNTTHKRAGIHDLFIVVRRCQRPPQCIRWARSPAHQASGGAPRMIGAVILQFDLVDGRRKLLAKINCCCSSKQHKQISVFLRLFCTIDSISVVLVSPWYDQSILEMKRLYMQYECMCLWKENDLELWPS